MDCKHTDGGAEGGAGVEAEDRRPNENKWQQDPGDEHRWERWPATKPPPRALTLHNLLRLLGRIPDPQIRRRR